MTMTPLRSTLLCAGLLSVAATSAQAGSLRFTIEAPGVQESQVTGHDLYREDFDGFGTGELALPASSAIGQYSDSYLNIVDQDVFGGANVPTSTTPKYATTDADGYTLSGFSAGGNSGPIGYFGFWWSAGNGNNDVIVNMADSTSQTFSTQSIIDSPNLQGSPGTFFSTPDGHYGNPNGPFNPPSNEYNSEEVYAFVNIYALDSKITSIKFQEQPGGFGLFESDNHTISFDLIDRDNQTGADVPVPATALLFGAGLGLIGWTRRRNGRSATASAPAN